MLVEQLIAQLQKLPPKATVYKSNSSGCSECNPECIDHYDSAHSVTYLAEGHWPNHRLKDIVVI